jgi:hypothetical protein
LEIDHPLDLNNAKDMGTGAEHTYRRSGPEPRDLCLQHLKYRFHARGRHQEPVVGTEQRRLLPIFRCAGPAPNTLELRGHGGIAEAEVAVLDDKVPTRLEASGEVGDGGLKGLESNPMGAGLRMVDTEVAVPEYRHAQDRVVPS